MRSRPRLKPAGSIGNSASGIYTGNAVLIGPENPLVAGSNVKFHCSANCESGGVNLQADQSIRRIAKPGIGTSLVS